MSFYYYLNDNNKVPSVLLGTYLINDEATLISCIEEALRCGYRGFDTAAVYRNEKLIGNILRLSLQKFSLVREHIFITSKLSPRNQGYENAKNAIRETIDNLGLEYIDLYLIHWPGTAKVSTESPLLLENRKGSWRALEEAQEAGLIRSIGVSNYMVKHLEEMKSYAKVMPSVNQVECHPFLIQKSLAQYCRDNNIHLQAYSSLGSTAHHSKLIENETVVRIASEVKMTPAQVLLKWAIQQEFSVLPKSTNLSHIERNFELFDWELSKEHMERLFELDKNEHFCWDPNTIV